MSVLSRLPERSMLGLYRCKFKLYQCPARATDFSRDVAKLVTHPLWPSRVPRITNCSAILGRCLRESGGFYTNLGFLKSPTGLVATLFS